MKETSVQTRTELTLGVAPVTVGGVEDGAIAVATEFVDGGGGECQVVLTVRNVGCSVTGPLDLTARADERSGRGFHRMRAVTHAISALEPGASRLIESIRLPRPCPVKVRGAVAAA